MKMPLPTQIMLEASDFVQDLRWWVAALAVAAAVVIVARLHRARPTGGCGGTRARLKLPLLGDALRKAETARFARAMATLVGNTVPLVQSHRNFRRPS